MNIVFKQYQNDQIHGSKIECLGKGSVENVYAAIEDEDCFPDENFSLIRDMNGHIIWELGDRSIQNGNNWIMYEQDSNELDYFELKALQNAVVGRMPYHFSQNEINEILINSMYDVNE